MRALGTIAGVIAACVAILALLYQTGVIGKETIIVEARCDPGFWFEVKTLQSDGRPLVFAEVHIASVYSPTHDLSTRTNETGIYRANLAEETRGTDPLLKSEVSGNYQIWPIVVRAYKSRFKPGRTSGSWSEAHRD
jgi:hypothetical protein